MMDLMRNRANFALTDSVYKSRSIAQGQDSERTSSNFRLADDPGVIVWPLETRVHQLAQAEFFRNPFKGDTEPALDLAGSTGWINASSYPTG